MRHRFLTFLICGGALLLWCLPLATNAAQITTYRDLLSDSGPATSSNHTITFTTTRTIPPSGTIRFEPEPGQFTIPATDFDLDNVELAVFTSGNFVTRLSTGTPSGTEDGVQITTGTSGNIEFTLNSTVGIPASSQIRILLGNHTVSATSTDLGLINPNATGTHNYYLITDDGVSSSRVRGHYAIVDKVLVPDFDTTETVPPFRFNGAPSGTISGTTLIVQISVETDEFAKCRYSTASGTPYLSMSNEFTSSFTTIHSRNVNVATNTTYTYFVRCTDDEDNVNTDDYVITFFVPEYPQGVPGDEGDEEDEGTGTGDGSGSTNNGTGGSGGSNQAGGSSGSGSGGGGGGGSGASSNSSPGGGGFEGSNKPYQSGDGLVIITGYASPRSTVTILVDGVKADEKTSGSDGSFSITLDEIARGAYTFGVYGTDRNGTRSSTFSTTFTVTGSRGSTLSNINVMPSIKITPDPVEPNSTAVISGYTIPNATVTLENQNDKSRASLKTFTIQSDSAGAWSIDVSTNGFTTGTYKARAKAVQVGGTATNFSGYTYYGVGQQADTPRTSDLNRDGKVNLTDFSILLFWWNTDGGASNPPADINRDGKVSLTDFSILIFNWTG